MTAFQAFIFDLDGTLVDSEALHFEAYHEVIEKYGGTLSREEFIEWWLIKAKGMRWAIESQKLVVDAAVAKLEKAQRFQTFLKEGVSVMPGVKKILDFAKRENISLAVASGSRLEEVDAVLRASGLAEYFPVRFGLDSVKQNKPDPEMFLAAAKQLGVTPDECLVFENTPMGIEAARAAKMKCIAAPSRFTMGVDLSGADVLLRSLNEWTPEILRSRT
ncbi:HAD family phosphatase [Candidatus Peregrinibacteria bacterium]|nr:HAD family phosphatase [Candidatus Peregrinibacteria bacterium]